MDASSGIGRQGLNDGFEETGRDETAARACDVLPGLAERCAARALRCHVILLTSSEQHALLARSIRVAVVGASPKPSHSGYDVFHYLRSQQHIDVAPINSAVSAIDGIEAYPTLRAYARVWGAPDIVTVCRNPVDAAKIAMHAIAVGAKAIWFQVGVATDEAIVTADRAGLAVVAERYIEVEFERLAGASAAERGRQRS